MGAERRGTQHETDARNAEQKVFAHVATPSFESVIPACASRVKDHVRLLFHRRDERGDAAILDGIVIDSIVRSH